VCHRHDRRYRHLPLEAKGDEDRHENEEHHERSNRLLGDAATPRRAHCGDAHVLNLDTAELCQLALHRAANVCWLVAHLHANATPIGSVQHLHLGRRDVDVGLFDHRGHLLDRQRRGGNLPGDASLEVDAEVETAGEQRDDRDDDEGDRQAESDPASTNEVEGRFSPIEAR